jgi:hypothetical protein
MTDRQYNIQNKKTNKHWLIRICRWRIDNTMSKIKRRTNIDVQHPMFVRLFILDIVLSIRHLQILINQCLFVFLFWTLYCLSVIDKFWLTNVCSSFYFGHCIYNVTDRQYNVQNKKRNTHWLIIICRWRIDNTMSKIKKRTNIG